MPLAPDDFTPDRLQRRFDFLVNRAEAHLGSEGKLEGSTLDFLPQACAATLYRDAACVALLQEHVGVAREFLDKSGSLFLALGLPVGATLIALAAQDGAEAKINARSDMLEAVRQQLGIGSTLKRDEFHPPMIDKAHTEPRQLLAMKQADWIWDVREINGRVKRPDRPLRLALERYGGHPTGTTGLSFDSYLAAAEWFVGPNGVRDTVPDSVVTALSALVATRAEQLRAARKDSYHWRMLPRPSELVDLDAVILMYLATNVDGTPKLGLEYVMDHRRFETPLLNAPMQIACSLHRDQNQKR